MDKSALRIHYRSMRRTISSEDAKLWSERLAECLRLRLMQASFNGVLFAYLPTPGEPDLLDFMRSARAQIAVPKVVGKGCMDFFLWSPGDPVTRGPFGILEPLELTHPVFPKSGDVAVIPALAIDRSGFRLGFGGGYYDRWLHEHRKSLVFTAGAVFPPFIFDGQLPRESFDERVDFLL
jgi:5-formyltetrahydrofolate cyclo-ligase